MATSKTINGDCLEELKKLDDNSIDLLCTDPPYGYGFMGKHWDTFQEKQSTKSQTVGWMSPGMKKSTYMGRIIESYKARWICICNECTKK